MREDSRKLILVRHAAVALVPALPPAQWHLSPSGRRRCRQLANEIAEYQPAVLVTSRETKALETGQILAAALDLPCQVAENLHEQDREGAPFFESKRAFEAAVIRLLTGPKDELLLGKETAAQAVQRFDRAVRNVLDRYPTGNVALVSHGTVMTLFLCHYNSTLSPVPFWQSLGFPSFKVVDLPGFKLRV